MMDINVDCFNGLYIFHKKTSVSSIKNENIPTKELAEELHKPIIRKLNKRKVHSHFTDNIWGEYLADMKIDKCIQ